MLKSSSNSEKRNKKDVSYLRLAHSIAYERSKCIAWQVGAIIVNNDRIVGTGHNGTPAGQVNCCDACSDLKNNGVWVNEEAKSKHHEWAKIHEIHAEINAIMYTSPNDRFGATMYTTLMPCADCAKAIAGSGIKRLVYNTEYHRTTKESLEILKFANIDVVHIPNINY